MSNEFLPISDFFYIIVMTKTQFSFQDFLSRLKSLTEHCEPVFEMTIVKVLAG